MSAAARTRPRESDARIGTSIPGLYSRYKKRRGERPPRATRTAAVLLHPSAGHHPVNGEQKDGAQYRNDPPRGLSFAVKAHGATDETAEQRTRDTKQYRDNEPTGIPARHQQLGDDTDHETEQNPRDN